MTSRIPTRNEQIVIPPGYEHIVEPRQYHLVENTWKEWNRAVRDFLGGETGFVLSHKGRMHNIHISTTNYISPKFGYIVGLVGMENWLLGQKSALLAGLYREPTI